MSDFFCSLVGEALSEVSQNAWQFYSQVGYISATWPWARPLPAAQNGSGKGHGKFQNRGHARAHARAPQDPKPCFPRNPAILLHGLKESSRKKLLNALVKSNFQCRFVEKQGKNMLPKVRVAADSKLCCPLPVFRLQRIPNHASLPAVPSLQLDSISPQSKTTSDPHHVYTRGVLHPTLDSFQCR